MKTTKNLYLKIAVLAILLCSINGQSQTCDSPFPLDDFNSCSPNPAWQSNPVQGNNQWQVMPDVAGYTIDGSCLMGIVCNGQNSATELQFPNFPIPQNANYFLEFDLILNSFDAPPQGLLHLVKLQPTPEIVVEIQMVALGLVSVQPIVIELSEEQVVNLDQLALVFADPTGNSGFVGVDNFRVSQNCDDGDPCTIDFCDPGTGLCLHTPIWEPLIGGASSPGPCYTYVGYVVSQNNIVVVDAVPAGTDLSDPSLVNQILAGDVLENGEVCTYVVNHVWAPTGCDDGDPCTIDFCDSETGICEHISVCDDGDPCTLDYCDPATGACTHVPVFTPYLTPPPPPGPCYDYIGVDVVVDFVYSEAYSTTPLSYLANPSPNEEVILTSETYVDNGVVLCDFVVGHIFVPKNCDDGDPCTLDYCEDNICYHDPLYQDALDNVPAAPACMDYIGAFVTSNGALVPSASTAPANYEIGPENVLEISSETLIEDGVVVCDWSVTHIFAPTNCDDGDPCTNDYCLDNICYHDPLYQDALDNIPAAPPCMDYVGAFVTANGALVPGASTAPLSYEIGPDNELSISSETLIEDGVVICDWTVTHIFEPKDCDDGDPCTTDFCDPFTNECVHLPLWIDYLIPPAAPAPCLTYIGMVAITGGSYNPVASSLPADQAVPEDGAGDSVILTSPCDMEFYYFWAPKDCDDGDPCTTDFCDPLTNECVHIPLWVDYLFPPATPAPCLEYIGAVVFQGGVYVAAASSLPETQGVPEGGAGDSVILTDPCDLEVYYFWAPKNCDDGDPCTIDVCNPATGLCEHTLKNITINFAAAMVTCFGAADGSIAASAAGGTGPYTYELWGPGGLVGSNNTGSFGNLAPGIFVLFAIDADGCEAFTMITITEPTEVILTANFTDVPCFGHPTGTITLSATGGSGGPYTYTINGFPANAGLNGGLWVGLYVCQAFDSQGCPSLVANVTISEPAQLFLNWSTTPETCAYTNDGTSTADGLGGVAPYTVTFDGGFPFPAPLTITELASADVHNWTVTDSNGCTAMVNFSVAEPVSLVADTISVTPSTTGTNGAIDVEVFGGVAPFSYTWIWDEEPDSVYSVDQDIFDLVADTFYLTVVDFNGCLDVLCVSVPGIPAIADTDGDGLSDWEEQNVYNTDWLDADSDDDGIDDGDEVNVTGTDPNDADSDDDGLNDGVEVYLTSTNPLNPDTDGNGCSDFDEFFGDCGLGIVLGCTYPTASNYNSTATQDDGSCEYSDPCPTDLDNSGSTSTGDLLILLASFGSSCD